MSTKLDNVYVQKSNGEIFAYKTQEKAETICKKFGGVILSSPTIDQINSATVMFSKNYYE